MKSHWQTLRQYQEQTSRYLRPQEAQALDLAVDLLMEQEMQELAREIERASNETLEASREVGVFAQVISSRTINALAVLYLRFKDAMSRRECLALETALDLARQRVVVEKKA